MKPVGVYHFGKLRHERFYLGAEVGVPELLQAIAGTHLTLSNHPNGGIVIHRLPQHVLRDRVAATDLPPDGPRCA